MSCNEHFVAVSKIEKELAKNYSKNTRKRDILLGVLKSPQFKDYYKAETGKEFDESVDAKQIENLVHKYYNSKYFSVTESSIVKLNKGRFTSYTARELAKSESIRIANELFYKGLTATGKDGKIHKYSSYDEMCKIISLKWERTALDRVDEICRAFSVDGVMPSYLQNIINSTDTSVLKAKRAENIKALSNKKTPKEEKIKLKEEINDLSKKIDDFNYKRIEGILTNDNFASPADANLFAVYYETAKEYIDDTNKAYPYSGNEFFKELKKNGSIKHIANLEGKYKEKYDYEADDEQNKNESSDGDDFIHKANQHLGDFDNYAKHADTVIRSYLSSLYKLKDANNLQSYDKDNELGIGTPMDVNQVMSVLYSRTDKSSLPNMIASIRRIASDDAEMRGLAQLAYDMENNFNLGFAIYSNFGKLVMPKAKISIGEEGHKYEISNPRAIRQDALRMFCLNEFRNTILNVDGVTFAKAISDLKEFSKKKDADVNHITLELIRLYNIVSPGLAKNAINLFIHKDSNTLTNCKDLILKLEAIGKKVEECRSIYYKNLETQASLRQDNYNSKSSINQIDNDIAIIGPKKELFEEIKRLRNKIKDNNRRINDLYKTDYIKNLMPAIYALSDAVVDYTSVKVELNSINVEGNSSSDVINSSMITSVINRLQKEASRIAFGKSNARYSGAMFSNILIERKNNGVLENPGLFRLTQNEDGSQALIPTEYCSEIIRFALFDGVKNNNSGESSLYENLSSDDYVVAAYDAFAHTDEKENVKTDKYTIPMVNYFTRIPSDAPKTFLCKAPKLSIHGLYKDASTLNRNHPIFKSFKNVFLAELNDSVQSLGRIFEVDETRHAIKLDANAKPVFRAGYSNNPTDARKAYDVYHVGTNKDQSRFFYKEDEHGNCILAGRAFHSDRFKLSFNQRNYADTIYGETLVDGKADGIINFLYGEGENGLNLSVTTGENDVVTNVSWSLSPQQEEAIDNMIENFIKDYAMYSYTKVQNYDASVFGGNIPSEQSFKEFVLNTYLMYCNFNELLEGDTKFYKDAQTFLKRAKEMQGSGVPYGITAFGDNFEPTLKTINSSLDAANIVVNGEKVVMKDGFKGITILNTIRTSDDAIRLFGTKGGNFTDGELVKKKVVTPEIAAKLADLYKGTKINDAQSYITFEEWIRRITARGQLPKYLPLIERILDESKELSAEDIQEFVQVQKNFYYDLHYDPQFDKFVPRQIKNAEYVLVPRFIKGTELEKVYNLMKEHNIDQLNTAETSKAGKKNVLSLFDENGLISEKNIEDFNKNAKDCAETYSYNNLYTQQEVAQHMDAANKAGIQIMKKILDNIDKNSPIYKYKKAITDAYCANIKESYMTLMNDLGIEVDENGTPKLEKDAKGEYIIKGLKLEKLYEMFAEEAQRTNADSNTLEFFSLTRDGNPILPPFLSNVSTKIESIIQSVFNNHVTRQLLSGFHAAQVTGVGMSSKIISQHEFSSKSGAKSGNKLQFHPTIEGEVKPYAECLIPMPKEYFNVYTKLLAEGKTKDEAEAAILQDMQKNTTDEFIAYRIPTEGKQSISVFKIVGFLDRAQGSTIVVADDWVSQTGSDFDVDSIYTITKSLTVAKDGSISVNKDDTAEGRGNIIVESMIAILSDKSSFEENLMPSNFKDIIDDRDAIIPPSVKKQRDYRTPYNPFDQASFQGDVTAGMTLKGMSVSRDNLCSLCNTIKPFISRPITCVYYESDGYNEKDIQKYTKNYRSYPVYDNNGKQIDTKFVVRHNSFGWGLENRNIKGRILTSYSSQTTAHILDAVKEGSIPNVNKFTFGVYKMFPDLGSDYKTCISFMAQPAITNLINTYQKGNSVFNAESYDYRKAKFDTIAEYAKRLGYLASDEKFNIKTFFERFESDDAVRRVCETLGIDEFLTNNEDRHDIYRFNVRLQIARLKAEDPNNKEKSEEIKLFDDDFTKLVYDVLVLKQFDELYYVSRTIGDYVRCANPDKFGAKVSNYETIKILSDIRKVSAEKLLRVNDVDLLESIYPDASSYNFLYSRNKRKIDFDNIELDDIDFNVRDAKNHLAYIISKSNTRTFYEGEITPEKNTIFVFGSNPKGIHGAGAAKVASEKFGAIQGQGEGLQGNSYALPTKNLDKARLTRWYKPGLKEEADVKEWYKNHDYSEVTKHPLNDERSMIPSQIIESIKKLYTVANQNPDKQFKVSYYPFGTLSLNGYLGEEMLAMFKLAGEIPNNIMFSSKWMTNWNKIVNEKKFIKTDNYSENDNNKYEEDIEEISEEVDFTSVSYNLDDSSYRSANYFLHYSTIISTLVEKSIFETEKSIFRDKINYLGELLGTPLNEVNYKSFKQWYLSTKIFRNTNFVIDGVEQNINQNDSVERISGLNKQIEFKFDCKDIQNPTDEEKKEFKKLTPGQKVSWIKQHSMEGGIFDRLDVNLGNVLQTSAIGTTHRITFNSDIYDIEDSLHKMKEAWYNNNWFVKETVVDLFKYAIVVENFSKKRFGITPLIVNDILVDTKFGENVVEELRKDVFSESDAHTYIRGHWRELNIPHTNWKFFTAKDLGHGNCFVFADSDSISAVKTAFRGNNKIPNYISLSDNDIDNGDNKCYIKIPIIGDKFLLAPINELMPNENSELSNKDSLNKDASLDYYIKYAAFFRKKEIEGESFNKQFFEKVSEYKKSNPKLVEHPIFDINVEIEQNQNHGFAKLVEDIRKGAAIPANIGFYVVNAELSKRLPSTDAASPQSYTDQVIDGVEYKIVHVNPFYTGNFKLEEACRKAIDEYKAWIQYYKYPNDASYREYFATNYFAAHPEFKNVRDDLKEIVRNSIRVGASMTRDVFYVVKNTPSMMHSSAGEISESAAASSYVKALVNDQRNGNDAAHRYVSEFDKEGIDIKNTEEIDANVPNILEKTKRYLAERSEGLLYDANNFFKDIEGNYHKLDDDETIEYIKNNKQEMNRWLKLYFDIKNLSDNYNYIREMGLDTNVSDPKTKELLEEIDDIIKNLTTQKFLKSAESKFVKLIMSQSGDELIANEWFDMTTVGYHKIGAIESLFTDAQETSIPLMQVILHLATSDVRAKELQMQKRVKEFTKLTDKIINDAISSGNPINWDNIVDEDGKLIRSYNKQFVEQYDKFREELRDIANDKTKGIYSVEYLRKRHERDAFLLDNVERKYVREYYEGLYKLEDAILNSETGYPLIYAKYKELSAKRVDILSHTVNGELSDTQKEELERTQDELDDLTNTFGKEYTFQILGEMMLPRNEWTAEQEQAINFSVEAVTALNKYIAGMSAIKEKYFNSSEKEAFRELLTKNLKTIFEIEQPDSNGVPTRAYEILKNNKEYNDAKNWIKYNARLVIDDKFRQLLSDAFKELDLVGKGTTGLVVKYARELKARDIAGVIDGRKFNTINPVTGKTYAQELKEDVCNKMNISATNIMDGRKLISNAPNEGNIVWKSNFWMNLQVDGTKNVEHIRIVNEINSILINGYDNVSKTVDTTNLSKNDLIRLRDLYDKIRPDYYSKEAVESGQFVKKYNSSANGKLVAEFIKENVDFNITDEQKRHYEAQRNKMVMTYGKNSEMFDLWLQVNALSYEKELPDGSITIVEEPNVLLYGSIRPKGAEGVIDRDDNGVAVNVNGNEAFFKWVDKQKTIANDIVRNFTKKVETEYYWTARREAYMKQPDETDAEAKERYEKWFEENHYFNPTTHRVEPIPCWVRTQYKDSNVNRAAILGTSDLYSYEPRWNQMDTEIKPEYSNEENYDKDAGMLGNYIPSDKRRFTNRYTSGPNNQYDNTVRRSAYEQDMYDTLNKIMKELCIFDKAKRYIQNGALPSKPKEQNHSKTWHVKQMAQGFGYWYNVCSNAEDWQDDVNYSTDYQIDMPGLKQLVDNSKGGTMEKLYYPKKSEFVNNGVFDEDGYNKKIEEVRKQNAEIEKHNQEIHKALLDRDWLTVMKGFMIEAAHFNAVQENKLMMYFGLDYLKGHKIYKTTLGKRRLKRDKRNSLGNNVRYEQEDYGPNTLKVYEAFCRRFIFNQFKKDQGAYTKGANLLQQWSSAKYMMLNVTGGIANVLYGETQIAIEAFANEYFTAKDWGVGKVLWLQSLTSFGANMYSDKASELGDGLCKFMNTLEFDKITELHEDNPSSKTKYKRLRDAGYCLQTIGEHFMQNGALLSILASHRIYKAPNGKWVATSEEKYVRNKRLEALKEVLGSNYSNFEHWIKSFSDDPNIVKDYATRRKDPITEYIRRNLTEEQKKEFITKQKSLEKEAREEFKTLPNVYDQFTLVDGYAEFKPDGILADRSKMSEEEAYNILGCIKNKTISVNKKIHGVYDKLGAARIEQEWYGGLIMQYHKHILPGIMKRWRREGYYNEDRESTEKGSYISLIDFLSIPYKDMKDIPESSKNVMTGIQNYFTAATKFLLNIKTNYNLLPDYEKANIRRCITEICMYLSAVCIAVALKMMDDDDEYEDNLPYNLCVYLADRLSTEIEMYTPRGAMGEAKKLWSQPIAAESGINDILNIVNNVSQMLLQGDEYNPVYKSGPYYNQNKVMTLITRQLPIYRSVSQVWRLPRNNKYYKRQATMASDMSDIIISQIKD